MNFNQLEYLRELYLRGSFLGAAKRLQITQPALSLQVQKLEEEIGFRLLDRNVRPIKFTQEGKKFYHKAVEILKLVEELKEASISISEEIEGLLKVGVIPTLAPYLVPLIIDELNKKFPNLILEISELKTEEIIRQLKAGELDCGLISTPIATKGVRFQPLFYEKFFIYVSENHPLYNKPQIVADDLDEEDLWYLEEGNCFRNQVNSICRFDNKNSDTQKLIYRSSSIESLRRIVENQRGATFIPELATITIEAGHEDLIKEFKGEPPVREISLALSKVATKERQAGALVEVILNSIPKRMHVKTSEQVLDTLLTIK